MDVPVLRYPNRIFVGGVAFQTTAIELRELFESYGAVRDVKIARDGEGVSRGYGFVTFFRDDDAKKVFKLGTVFYKGKRLVIGEAYRKLSFGHVPDLYCSYGGYAQVDWPPKQILPQAQQASHIQHMMAPQHHQLCHLPTPQMFLQPPQLHQHVVSQSSPQSEQHPVIWQAVYRPLGPP
ncbi:protein boule-like [Nematostella vectensis]|uniref:protein boule-like n=1 Tax=Nematostella vectensis TaxID=45351 RepID=UPI00207795FB|nr:protein boule-like [Nematostella vectensis]